MVQKKEKKKVVALLSGGLDSTLAVYREVLAGELPAASKR